MHFNMKNYLKSNHNYKQDKICRLHPPTQPFSPTRNKKSIPQPMSSINVLDELGLLSMPGYPQEIEITDLVQAPSLDQKCY